jgi:hypothetical protein
MNKMKAKATAQDVAERTVWAGVEKAARDGYVEAFGELTGVLTVERMQKRAEKRARKRA